MSAFEDLHAATDLFLRRAEQALSSGDPKRGQDAVRETLEAVETTLPQQADALRNDHAPLDEAHERLARAVLDKRLAEVEGILMQLKLAYGALGRRELDVLRFVALLTAARRVLLALRRALALWIGAFAPRPPVDVDPMDAMRAAREALVAGVPEAAPPALAAALRAGLAKPLGLGPEASAEDALDRWIASGVPLRFEPDAAREVAAALAEGTTDAVRAWAWLDAVEHVVNMAGMTPPP